ncbi:MAG: S8 family serine peptidase, partial [Bacteroidota bacterium]
MKLSFWSGISKYCPGLFLAGLIFILVTFVRWETGHHNDLSLAFAEDDPARQLHQSRLITSIDGFPDTLTGKGVVIAIGDDGLVDPHIDLQGRVDQSLVNLNGINHEDMVAGILAGAGNLNPKARGIAPEATLIMLDNFDAIQFADQLVNDQSVSIISISQGDGCNTGYTFMAKQADQFARQKPFLL